MVQPIIRDVIFLGQKSAPATEADLQTAQDLLDTLNAHADECVGLAANMIGVAKCIIAFDDGGLPQLMLNPEILKAGGPYQTTEACLSLQSRRPTTRYRTIKVRWQNEKMQTRIKSFSGWTAQIIQHEIDHCNGVII